MLKQNFVNSGIAATVCVLAAIVAQYSNKESSVFHIATFVFILAGSVSILLSPDINIHASDQPVYKYDKNNVERSRKILYQQVLDITKKYSKEMNNTDTVNVEIVFYGVRGVTEYDRQLVTEKGSRK